MSEQEAHSRALVVQKMTRDGLVEQNKTTGASTSISARSKELSYDKKSQESSFKQRIGDVKDKSSRKIAIQRNHAGERLPEEKASGRKNPSKRIVSAKKNKESLSRQGRLIVSLAPDNPRLKTEEKKGYRQEEQKTDKKTSSQAQGEKAQQEDKKKTKEEIRIEKLEEKVCRRTTKANKLYKKTPKKHRLHFEYEKQIDYSKFGKLGIEKNYDKNLPISPDDMILVKKLKFKTDEMKPWYYKRPRIRREIARKGEHKVFENEGDNLGLEGTHIGYRAERKIYRIRRKARKKRHSKQFKYKKAERRAVSAENKLAYQKFLREHPEAKNEKKNRIQKAMQKQRYKRQYAQAAHDAKKTGEAVSAARTGITAAAKKLMQIVMANKTVVLIIAAVLLVIFFLFYAASAISMIFGQLASGLMAGTIQADYQDMTDCENSFKQMEAELENRIKHIEEEYPDYDEYQYDLDRIGHDSMMLLSYFGAKYVSFTFAGAQSELVEIFNLMYDLQLEEKTEIRQKWGTVHDPITGEEKEGWEEYECRILNITLTVTPLEDILGERMNEEEKKQFDIYQDSKGGQNIYPNPFDFDWHSSISSPFGYRVHPISGDLKFHSGVDIAAPEGTTIHSCMEGTVVKAGWSDSYGNFVEIQNKNGSKTKYAHCSKLLVNTGQEVKRKDAIAEVGSTGNSTGNHLHLEFISADGTYLNPFFVVSNSNKREE